MPGSTIRLPSGLASSLAILAMNFEVPTPTEAVSPSVASVIAARSSSTTRCSVAVS